MDMNYVLKSVQGPHILCVGLLSIGLVALVIAAMFWNEKKLQAGNEDEH